MQMKWLCTWCPAGLGRSYSSVAFDSYKAFAEHVELKHTERNPTIHIDDLCTILPDELIFAQRIIETDQERPGRRKETQ